MSNISVYHNNALTAGTTTSSGVATGSSVSYLADNRLSFKYVTAGGTDTVQLDQAANNIIIFTDLAIIDHNLVGERITITSYPTSSRSTPTVEVNSQAIGSADPFILNLGTLSQYQFIDIDLTITGSVNTANVGELGLYTKFTSPISPAVGIRTNEIPRSTFVLLPNGERQTIKRGGVVRQKIYTIGGLSISQANEWIDVFTNNAGAQMVILDDERGDQYPCMMNQTMTINDTIKILAVNLDFTEVKLS